MIELGEVLPRNNDSWILYYKFADTLSFNDYKEMSPLYSNRICFGVVDYDLLLEFEK